MPRPADGLCVRCRRRGRRTELPPEHLRDQVTAGTDVCARCGRAVLAKTPGRGAWLHEWRARLAEALRTAAEYLDRQASDYFDD